MLTAGLACVRSSRKKAYKLKLCSDVHQVIQLNLAQVTEHLI